MLEGSYDSPASVAPWHRQIQKHRVTFVAFRRYSCEFSYSTQRTCSVEVVGLVSFYFNDAPLSWIGQAHPKLESKLVGIEENQDMSIEVLLVEKILGTFGSRKRRFDTSAMSSGMCVRDGAETIQFLPVGNFNSGGVEFSAGDQRLFGLLSAFVG